MKCYISGHYTNQHHRLAVSGYIDLPFAPFPELELWILDDEEPALTVESVGWHVDTSEFHLFCHCDLDWDNDLFLHCIAGWKDFAARRGLECDDFTEERDRQ